MTLQREQGSQGELVSAEAAGTISVALALASIGIFIVGMLLLGFAFQDASPQPDNMAFLGVRDIVETLLFGLMFFLQLVAALLSMYALVLANNSSKPDQARSRAKSGLAILGGFLAFVLCFGTFVVAYYGS
jgi:small-conductance mechanosensitive channel